MSEIDLINIEPVAFQRQLARNESERIRRQLNDVYDIEDRHWYPLSEGSKPEHAIFYTDFLVHMNEFQLLREVLSSKGFLECLEVHEWGPPDPDYEIELSIWDKPYASDGEQHSTSDRADWVVYVSPESSITIKAAE